MKINENAKIVLQRRYLAKDPMGNVTESIEQMFRRVADAVAAPDKQYDKNVDLKKTSDCFFTMMSNLDFLPNSPTLMNAGRPLGQLSACFVLPIEDSMEGIFETLKNAALIHKSGGGTGFSFSRLRSSGSSVNSTGGVASGPVSFMKVFNAATEAVKQGGTRRGANMGILRIDHPDILEFIDCKSDTSQITNFNISIGITEAFMEAVKNQKEYDLIDPKTQKPMAKLNAAQVFDKIVDAAWKTGEPGIIFLDRLNRDNVVPSFGQIEATNPCGEQPLLPYESCNLGSINLVAMLKKNSNGHHQLDWDKLAQTVCNAVHFLDNVIDANCYPLPVIDETTKKMRKIGLGVMGFADMLLHLLIPYNSDDAVALAKELMQFITKTARQKSHELALERGAFPLFKQSTLDQSIPMRNATVTTIAPTGTISIIASVSSGIEPIFAYVYYRNIMDSTKLMEVSPILKETLHSCGLYSDELMERIASGAHLCDIEELPDDIKNVFVSAHEVSPHWHIEIQSAFQQYTDNAVSKTVNFSNDATREEVKDVYFKAYEQGCKGVTIYRDGSRDSQVLNIGTIESKPQETQEDIAIYAQNPNQTITPRARPDITTGITEKVQIGCGNLYITVNYDENGICEVFTNTGKAGGCPSQSEATSRLVSITLRSGLDADVIIEQLKGIRCPSTIRQPNMTVTSCPDAIAKVIEKVVKFQNSDKYNYMALSDFNNAKPKHPEPDSKNARYCPECQSKLEHEGGCVSCRSCGYSKCM